MGVYVVCLSSYMHLHGQARWRHVKFPVLSLIPQSGTLASGQTLFI